MSNRKSKGDSVSTLFAINQYCSSILKILPKRYFNIERQILYILAKKGAMPQTEMAEELGIKAATLASRVSSLERKGLVITNGRGFPVKIRKPAETKVILNEIYDVIETNAREYPKRAISKIYNALSLFVYAEDKEKELSFYDAVISNFIYVKKVTTYFCGSIHQAKVDFALYLLHLAAAQIPSSTLFKMYSDESAASLSTICLAEEKKGMLMIQRINGHCFFSESEKGKEYIAEKLLEIEALKEDFVFSKGRATVNAEIEAIKQLSEAERKPLSR